MKKRRLGESANTERKHIEFAKNLFISWDDDGSGQIELKKIIQPLVSLGLTDSSFISQVFFLFLSIEFHSSYFHSYFRELKNMTKIVHWKRLFSLRRIS
jgi:hypothetical protein